MFNGLIAPSLGAIEIDGRSLQQFSGGELRALRRRSMAMVFQSFALFPQRSALENAAFGLEIAGVPRRQRLTRAQQALERVGLGQDLHRKPDQLSGGMRQRVGLARALALDPPVLLMDEAFSALDPLIRSDMQDLLLDLQREHRRTIVFISHDLDEAVRIGDRIALMQDGRLLQCDAAETLFRSPAEPAVAEFFRGVDPAGVLTVGAIADPSAPSVEWDPTDPDRTVLSSTMLIKEAIPIGFVTGRPERSRKTRKRIQGVSISIRYRAISASREDHDAFLVATSPLIRSTVHQPPLAIESDLDPATSQSRRS